MLPYKWTFKEKETGDLYFLIYINERTSDVLLARKADGEIFHWRYELFTGRDFIFVEEAKEPTKSISKVFIQKNELLDKVLDNHAHKGKA